MTKKKTTSKKKLAATKKAVGERYGHTPKSEYDVVLTFRMIKDHVWCDSCKDIHKREGEECSEDDWFSLFTRTITSEKKDN